jgi:hypothetical protein
MTKTLKSLFLYTLLLTVSFANASPKSYQDLEILFAQWRTFERPMMINGAPDYTQAAFDKRHMTFKALQTQLNAFGIDDWSVENQIDWQLIRAEMNGYDFNYRILKPWQRDPAFYKTIWTYKSDVPAHEGPTHHNVTELWTYTFPLTVSEQQRLINDLSVIKPLNSQALINLTGNARELWIAGIRDIEKQLNNLKQLSEKIRPIKNPELTAVLEQASESTQSFIDWLQAQGKTKTGASGIGKDNYTWYQQNVHLVPMSWDDEVLLLQRELDRAWSSLKLEEHRNRNLPPLKEVQNQQEYSVLAEKSARFFIDFLKQQEIVTVPDYFEEALRPHLGTFVPKATRNFFYIGTHLDPTPLYSHFYHWFELARMEYEPHASLMRRGPLLYNIFDSRNEGTATAVEEIFMHAGLYDHNPRAREIVWIMVTQRAARGLGSLYAHANIMTMEEAGQVHMDWTPRGWMKTEPELLIFEQHFYLRQPGYGTSYITGKYLLEKAMAEYAKRHEEQNNPFVLKTFFDDLNAIGNIPISLGHWQLTGDKKQLEKTMKPSS